MSTVDTVVKSRPRNDPSVPNATPKVVSNTASPVPASMNSDVSPAVDESVQGPAKVSAHCESDHPAPVAEPHPRIAESAQVWTSVPPAEKPAVTVMPSIMSPDVADPVRPVVVWGALSSNTMITAASAGTVDTVTNKTQSAKSFFMRTPANSGPASVRGNVRRRLSGKWRTIWGSKNGRDSRTPCG